MVERTKPQDTRKAVRSCAHSAFATGLLEAVEAAAQLAHELAAAAVDTGRGAHVKVFVDGGLQVGLPNVERGQVIVTRSGNGEDEPDGERLDDGGKDAIEINPVLSCSKRFQRTGNSELPPRTLRSLRREPQSSTALRILFSQTLRA